MKNEVIFFISLVFTNKDKVAEKYEKYEHKKSGKNPLFMPLCSMFFLYSKNSILEKNR